MLASANTDDAQGRSSVEVSYFSRESATMWGVIWHKFWRHKLGGAGMIFLAALFSICIIVPVFVSEDAANEIDFSYMRSGPSLAHPFGADDIGRDILLRCIFGGRISLLIGSLAGLISVIIGVTIGAVAGYNPGWIDSGLMRFVEALLSIPRLFILIVMAKVVGNSVAMVTVVIGVLSWMGVSRIVRGNVLSIKEQDFVLAARSVGTHPRDILVTHIVPNTIGSIVVAATLGVGEAIIMEASLSFLGLGIQPPTSTWGNMLNRGQSFLVDAPWIAVFPGLLILITVLCINFIGDGLRDALGPNTLR